MCDPGRHLTAILLADGPEEAIAGETLRGILQQSEAPARIKVVGADRRIDDLISQYGATSKIEWIRVSETSLPKTLQGALADVTTPYVYFTGSGPQLHPEHFESLCALAGKDEDVKVVASGAILEPDGWLRSVSEPVRGSVHIKGQVSNLFEAIQASYVARGGLVWKTNFLKSLLPVSETFYWLDWLLVVRAVMAGTQVKSTGKPTVSVVNLWPSSLKDKEFCAHPAVLDRNRLLHEMQTVRFNLAVGDVVALGGAQIFDTEIRHRWIVAYEQEVYSAYKGMVDRWRDSSLYQFYLYLERHHWIRIAFRPFFWAFSWLKESKAAS